MLHRAVRNTATVLPSYLQESLVQYEVFSGEVEGAVLTQLSVPVLTPRPVGWVQIERLG